MNIEDLNMSGIGSGDIKLDESIACRVCLASEIKLCDITDLPKSFSMKPDSKPVYLVFTVIYVPTLELYFAKWDLRGDYDPPEQHRTIVKPWSGGLWVTVQATEHLKEAIRLSIARVVSGEYYINTKGKPIVPDASLIQDFKDAGWVEPTTETAPSAQ
jgi:hypothetical protein